ncbi:MAG: hypothetical protein HKP30_01565, partial [Myxococcales bacterium]|nr:hypothetical protein [Myxococcales bacterium]
MTLELLVHPEDVAAERARVGVALEMAPGWHVYGSEAGETGIPTEVRGQAAGGEVSPLAWPPTETFGDEEVGYTGQGYSGSVLLPALARFAGPERRLRAEVSLLACADECIPAEAVLELAWSGASLPPQTEESARAAFSLGTTDGGSAGLLRALLLALAGGLLLNLMPCV